MISQTHKFIFIHAPKVTGNSIQLTLKQYTNDEFIDIEFKNDIQHFNYKFGE